MRELRERQNLVTLIIALDIISRINSKGISKAEIRTTIDSKDPHSNSIQVYYGSYKVEIGIVKGGREDIITINEAIIDPDYYDKGFRRSK